MTRDRVRTEPVSFAALPRWAEDDHAAALAAFKRSARRLLQLGPAPARSTALLSAAAQALAQSDDTSRTKARQFFEAHFTPHKLHHHSPAGLLTGYYAPVIAGAPTRRPGFEVPLHARPGDLVNVVDEADRGAAERLTHLRRTSSGDCPYYTRAEIDEGALDGQGLELAWIADPVDRFFMQVQGSGIIAFGDGAELALGYDGKNGHPYTSIGRWAIAHGHIEDAEMSLARLGAWLRADPERGRKAMWQNQSYVFFRQLPHGQGPLGALDIPLTAGRSLAVDTTTLDLGLPVYVTAPELRHADDRPEGFARLMIAQDVGSAIRGPERGDIFFGVGAQAGDRAGITRHVARFHVLVPNEPVS